MFVLPSYFPLLPLLVVRPPGVSRWAVALEIMSFGWFAYISATHFIPRVQVQLWRMGVSTLLITELIRNNL